MRRKTIPLTPTVHRYLLQAVMRNQLSLKQLAGMLGYELSLRRRKRR